MDGRGRALDNIFVERLWRNVKYENVYLKVYAWMAELMVGDTLFRVLQCAAAASGAGICDTQRGLPYLRGSRGRHHRQVHRG